MATKSESFQINLEPAEERRLKSLCGPFDDNIKLIERRLNVEISYRDNHFTISGTSQIAKATVTLLTNLYVNTAPIRGSYPDLNPEDIHLALTELHPLINSDSIEDYQGSSTPYTGDHPQLAYGKEIHIKTKKGIIKPRTPNQAQYMQNIVNYDISFGIGPAGTGKTYLAVAAAVNALEQQEIRKILLTRPAVEAGEKLGFLPGDLSQKVDPYLRPLYDALFEMLGFERVEKLIERSVIEIAPLAYMRGRTLNDAFIILDESQNTTIEQMKMFLTRIGFNSKAVITGDITQVDLPHNSKSGLKHAIEVLSELDSLSFNYFIAEDIVRHPVVAKIVTAYEKWDHKQEEQKKQEKQNREKYKQLLVQNSQPSIQQEPHLNTVGVP